jgi:hypothetical protein
MTDIGIPQSTVVRTSRGLSIAGRRLTLYSIMDYLRAGWPPAIPADDLCILGAQGRGQLSEWFDYPFSRLLQRLSRFDMTGCRVESRPLSS